MTCPACNAPLQTWITTSDCLIHCRCAQIGCRAANVEGQGWTTAKAYEQFTKRVPVARIDAKDKFKQMKSTL